MPCKEIQKEQVREYTVFSSIWTVIFRNVFFLTSVFVCMCVCAFEESAVRFKGSVSFRTYIPTNLNKWNLS
jgi:hypothetical protein